MSGMRTIVIVTGSRAEYGLLSGLLRQLSENPAIAVRIIVTGAHLSPRFGETWREIEADGFRIDAKVPLDLEDDSPNSTARAMAQALSGIAAALEKLNPEIVVLLGDRYEILAAAEAALLLRIPVAHIHGGELTAGAMDDAMRHAITKMAHLHFTAADDYSRRVIQLGEDPANVFTVGAVGLDFIDELPAFDRDALSAHIGIEITDPLFLITYHPTTWGKLDPSDAIEILISALEQFPEATKLFTGVNADPGNQAIAARIAKFVNDYSDRAACVESLGRSRYFSAVRGATAVIGNSSSGIIEAPALRTPTVNIGDRQEGRLRSSSVIDCAEDAASISKAIRKAMSPAFRESLSGMAPAYGKGGAIKCIAEVLSDADLSGIVQKRFHDLRAARFA
jgi:UDP-hydrolysing UDP-N-acetyl-D-glucosamine 2-epimerase